MMYPSIAIFRRQASMFRVGTSFIFYSTDAPQRRRAKIRKGYPFLYILPMYIDRWRSTKDYEKLAEEYVSDESEPDDGKQKKKDWWSTDIKVEFNQLKTENPDMISTRSCAASYFLKKDGRIICRCDIIRKTI